jgi:Tol biopolymer transport system component/DNA-binding winged helix-turn-helix (wHTH) protein
VAHQTPASYPMAESYVFGAYRLDVAGRMLTREGQIVPLPPKTFELLLLMAERPGRAFSRHELMAALWPDTVVEEANLTYQVSILRKALGEAGTSWVETVPKHGYRFTADVKRSPGTTSAAPVTTMAPSVSAPSTGVTRTAWVIAAAALLVSAAAWLFLSRGERGETERPTSAVAVPLTAYPGYENAPTLSPDGSQVAFSWNGPGQDNYDIYIKLVGPGPALRLTTDPGRDDTPAWSPDGRLIAFLRFTSEGTADFIVVPALGGAERRVATAIPAFSRFTSPTMPNLNWSPDGRWLAFGRFGRGVHEAKERGIWLIAVDGSERRRLTDSLDIAPSFSPDGRYLAFIRFGATRSVHVLPLASAMTAAAAPRRVSPEMVWVLGLAWVPDGRALVFSSSGHLGLSRLQRVSLGPDRLVPLGMPEPLPFGEQSRAVTVSATGRLVYSAQVRDSNIWKVSLDGPPRLAAAPLPGSTFDDHVPDYSPDGKRIAFSSTRSGVEDLWISDADGSNPVQVTTFGGAQCSNAHWSPDGRTVLFASRRDGPGDLYLLRPDSGEQRRITDHASDENEPRWSRDGGTIFFVSNRTGRYEGFKMPAAGGEAVRVTPNGGMTPAESPDGRFLYYAKDAGSPTSIWRIPIGGGEETKIADGLSYSTNFVVAERGLYFLAVGGAPHDTSIDFYEFATGKRTRLLVVGKQWWYGMALAPDQRSLLISTVDSAGSNLMVVDRIQ